MGLVRNITWLTAGNLVAQPLWLLFSTVLCVRLLGDAGYGIFTATLALTSIVAIFSDFGLRPYTIREVARQRGAASQFFTNLFAARIALAVVALAVALGAGWVLDYQGPEMLALAFAGGYTLTLKLLEYCRAYFQAFERMRDEALSSMVEKAIVITFGTALLWRYRTPEAVLAGMTMGMVVTLALTIRWTTRRYAPFRPALLDPAFLRRVLPAAFPLGLAGQFAVIYFRTDAVMVEAMVGAVAAGQYGAAYRLIGAVVLMAGLVVVAVYPRLSRLFHERDAMGFRYVFHRAAAALAGLGLLVGAGLFLLATPIMIVIKGDIGVAPSADALRILAGAVPFITVNYLLGTTMNASDDQRLLAWVHGLAAMFNLGVNFVLIPTYSFYGAAAATVATEALIFFAFLARYLSHTRKRLDPLTPDGPS